MHSLTEVVAFDNLSNGRLSNLDGTSVTFVEGDITNPDDLDKACDGATAIVHLAALGSVPRSIEFPLATHHNNATGALQVLQAAKRAGDLHTIVASSSSVYGATLELPKHEALPTRPMSPYAVSKVATESYALAFQHSMGLPTLAFRFFNVFGPLQPADHVYAAVIPLFLDAAMAGRPLTVFGDGLQSRDFTYVDTVCETITRAIVEKTTCEIAGQPGIRPATHDSRRGRPRSKSCSDQPVDIEHESTPHRRHPPQRRRLDPALRTVPRHRTDTIRSKASKPPSTGSARCEPGCAYRGQRLRRPCRDCGGWLAGARRGAWRCCRREGHLDGTGAMFRQTRAGLHGEPFECFKFRTMVHGDNPLIPDDSRITSAGKWLRRFSLDELPQLTQRGPWRHEHRWPPTHAALPGRTLRRTAAPAIRRCRPASPAGPRSTVATAIDWPERIELDLEYVDRNKAPLFDLTNHARHRQSVGRRRLASKATTPTTRS